MVALCPHTAVSPKTTKPDRGASLRRYQHGSVHLNFKLNLLLVAAIGAPIASLSTTTTTAHAQSGIASVYSTKEGTRTASGVTLNDNALTAAHKSLPFGSKVRVTNRKNGKSVVVTITDRGPFVRGRVIDVTPAAARALGFNGLASVTLNPGG
jgi:rare lipoprotein A